MKFTLALTCFALISAVAYASCEPGYLKRIVAASRGNCANTADLAGSRAIAFDTNPNGDRMFVANTAAGTVTIHDRKGEQIGMVTVPAQREQSDTVYIGSPTGLYFNNEPGEWFFGPDRPISERKTPILIGCTFDGAIIAWDPQAEGHENTFFRVMDQNYKGSGFTGLVFVRTPLGPRVYVADWKLGMVFVAESRYRDISTSVTRMVENPFVDPELPVNYVPFNTFEHEDVIYVSYAQKAADGTLVTGAGKGYISKYGFDGAFLGRFASAGTLNAPYGMVIATAGELAGQLLVGNVGDGRIFGYDLSTGAATELKVRNAQGDMVAFRGKNLYSLLHGPGNNFAVNKLYAVSSEENDTKGSVAVVRYKDC